MGFILLLFLRRGAHDLGAGALGVVVSSSEEYRQTTPPGESPQGSQPRAGQFPCAVFNPTLRDE